MRTFNINQLTISNNLPFVLIAGPCQIESQAHAEDTCARLIAITALLGIPLIYKSSFDKANRSSISTKRGVGIEEGLQILNTIKHTFGVPVLTDIHESYQARECADAGIDILQIPAFLCRQTDLLLAAGETGCAINVQQPGGMGERSGGDRTMVPYLARAAVATGCVSTLFMECHEDPDRAPSDGPNMIKLDDLSDILKDLVAIDEIVKRR
jgi:3-deoxy-D-manno-octulosonic acid (KDO) 8-phosphate synthase